MPACAHIALHEWVIAAVGKSAHISARLVLWHIEASQPSCRRCKQLWLALDSVT